MGFRAVSGVTFDLSVYGGGRTLIPKNVIVNLGIKKGQTLHVQLIGISWEDQGEKDKGKTEVKKLVEAKVEGQLKETSDLGLTEEQKRKIAFIKGR
jgi:bifunctional DNA-binding transcriptional regulator/antitoxin component of YhaV-PrlF toxin-antitoxin module